MSLFPKYFKKDVVIQFFQQMNQEQSKETMYKFDIYHSTFVLDKFLCMFSPPSIWEIWDRWISLPSDKQSEYS